MRDRATDIVRVGQQAGGQHVVAIPALHLLDARIRGEHLQQSMCDRQGTVAENLIKVGEDVVERIDALLAMERERLDRDVRDAEGVVHVLEHLEGSGCTVSTILLGSRYFFR